MHDAAQANRPTNAAMCKNSFNLLSQPHTSSSLCQQCTYIVGVVPSGCSSNLSYRLCIKYVHCLHNVLRSLPEGCTALPGCLILHCNLLPAWHDNLLHWPHLLPSLLHLPPMLPSDACCKSTSTHSCFKVSGHQTSISLKCRSSRRSGGT